MFQDAIEMVEYKGKQYAQYHGSPFDRGSADSWYSRPCDPHYYPNGTYNNPKIGIELMSTEDIEAYHAGYNWNEEFGGKKDWD